MCADTPTSRSDRVAGSLRNAILSGRLRPDEVLVERRLADMLGVSKTPVREALIMLSGTGLVTLTRNRGMTVRRLTLVEVQQVYEERVLLEPWAVAQAIARGGIDFDAAAATMDKATEHAEAGDATALTVTNRQFHRALYSACENMFIVQALDQLQDLTVLAIGLVWENWPNRHAETVEHQEILQAARAGDAPKAEALVRLHIDRSLSRIRARNTGAR
jgi:DNA-binding GntR family transcriptional regulator